MRGLQRGPALIISARPPVNLSPTRLHSSRGRRNAHPAALIIGVCSGANEIEFLKTEKLTLKKFRYTVRNTWLRNKRQSSSVDVYRMTDNDTARKLFLVQLKLS